MSQQTMKRLAAHHRKKLKRIQDELLGMASEWDDRDGYFQSVLERAADSLDETIKELAKENVRDGW